MWDALTITEDEAAGLSELAALDLAMARDFAARAQAEPDPDTANDLARSYQRVARSYRQSLALKVRLARELIRLQQGAPPPPRDEARIRARVDELRSAARRVIWAEHEPADCDEPDDGASELFFGILEDHLEDKSRDDRFGLTPLDDHVVEVCNALALSTSLARRWRDLADPPGDEPANAADPDWRGSG
jgi:hypothetical protein